jgi:hypothetical protein
MKGFTKDIVAVFSAVAVAPPGCADCVAYCAEGRISCDCRGDFHPQTCENSSCYEESEETWQN